ncbi:MAG: OmpA family protein [Crocinitomicaceae bacterium]
MKTVLPFILLATFCFCTPSYVFSQDDEDESCLEPGKKVMKLITKVAENPKKERMERIKAYTDAIEMAPENAYIFYSFANYNYEKALETQDNFEEGRTNFKQLSIAYEAAATGYKKVLEYCPDYHSDVYYKLGTIYYTLGDKGQASMYFKKFVEFKDKDPNKYSDTYAKNKRDVEEILPEMEFFEQFFNNTVPYEPVKVENVSSDKHEYLPMISPDNELLFYTRKGEGSDKGIIKTIIEEFTLSQRPGPEGTFTTGNPLRSPFNTPKFTNYGGVSLSLDNKEMYICACQEVDYQEHANCDLYVTHFERIERSEESRNDFKWTELENLGPAINTKDGWEAQPTISADGNTLYFASWREGSRLTDIYYSTRGKDGKWSNAKLIPGPVNSEGHDKAPFLHQDSETLYFVSDCSLDRRGAGGSDIFYTRKDSTGNWMEPKNIGYPINTEANEVGLIVSTDGKLAYFTTSSKSSSFDIYYFELYEEARPKKVLFIKGEVIDDKGQPVKDAIVEVSYKASKKNVEVNVNGDDGKYAAVINVDEDQPEDVLISMKKEGYSFDTKLIKGKDIAETNVTFKNGENMQIEEIKVGKAFTIDNILYETKSYALSDDSKFVLDQFLKFLKENPTVKVSVQGHTDNEGDPKENQVLSENRAKGVVNYLVENGIDRSRLKYEGFGQAQPKVPNTNDENKALNRRTDIMITEL